MKTKLIPVKVFEERAYCDCGGELEAGNIEYSTYPPIYPHKCNACGKTTDIRGAMYPRRVYKYDVSKK